MTGLNNNPGKEKILWFFINLNLNKQVNISSPLTIPLKPFGFDTAMLFLATMQITADSAYRGASIRMPGQT